MQDVEQAIRERAYQLWIDSGRDDGSAELHWITAQREVLSGSLKELGRVMSSGATTIERTKKAKVSRKRRAA
jgi:hypothetical protein